MNQVDPTAFFTPASTRLWPEVIVRVAARWPARWLRASLALLLCLGAWLPAHATDPTVEQIGLQRSADGLYLSARLQLAPSAPVEDALLRGVPLYFVWQVDVLRDRWYWTDKRVASTQRTLRLIYQPLTRRWRVSVSNDPEAARGGAGLQYALHQNFDSLPDALAGVSRVSRWRISDASSLAAGGDQRVEVAFRLDLTLLPRPFQIGMANQPEWLVEFSRRLDVPATIEPEAPPAPPTPPDEVKLQESAGESGR
jgi:hypothetical protein